MRTLLVIFCVVVVVAVRIFDAPSCPAAVGAVEQYHALVWGAMSAVNMHPTASCQGFPDPFGETRQVEVTWTFSGHTDGAIYIVDHTGMVRAGNNTAAQLDKYASGSLSTLLSALH